MIPATIITYLHDQEPFALTAVSILAGLPLSLFFCHWFCPLPCPAVVIACWSIIKAAVVLFQLVTDYYCTIVHCNSHHQPLLVIVDRSLRKLWFSFSASTLTGLWWLEKVAAAAAATAAASACSAFFVVCWHHCQLLSLLFHITTVDFFFFFSLDHRVEILFLPWLFSWGSPLPKHKTWVEIFTGKVDICLNKICRWDTESATLSV